MDRVSCSLSYDSCGGMQITIGSASLYTWRKDQEFWAQDPSWYVFGISVKILDLDLDLDLEPFPSSIPSI